MHRISMRGLLVKSGLLYSQNYSVTTVGREGRKIEAIVLYPTDSSAKPYYYKISSFIPPLLLVLFLTLIFLHSLGGSHRKCRRLIHTDIAVTHQVKSEFVLTR